MPIASPNVYKIRGIRPCITKRPYIRTNYVCTVIIRAHTKNPTKADHTEDSIVTRLGQLVIFRDFSNWWGLPYIRGSRPLLSKKPLQNTLLPIEIDTICMIPCILRELNNNR
jgi:hypothetical protein